jgi:hypothetical protein
LKRRAATVTLRIIGGQACQPADALHPIGLLDVRGERKTCCRASSGIVNAAISYRNRTPHLP